MNDEERYRRGANARRKILGNAWVDRADANRSSFNAEWQDFITRCAWGEIWTRPHFDERTRRVLVIGTMMAIGRWEEFRMHLREALVEGGFTPDDIKEIILQQAIYCGVPVANHAVKEASTIVAELGTFEDRDRGESRDSSPPTPPYVRVRIRRFGELGRSPGRDGSQTE